MEETGRRTWAVSGMDCAACAAKVTGAVSRLPGVADVEVAVMAERLSLRLTPGGAGPEEVEAAVRQLGYGIGTSAAPEAHAHHHDHPHEHGAEGGFGPKATLLALSAGGLALAWGASRLGDFGPWPFVIGSLPGLIPVARRAFAALRARQPFTIEGLMTLAALGAFAIGAAEEAAVVIFLFLLGEVLEGVATNQARRGIKALSALVPQEAVTEDGTTVPVAALTVGQRLRIAPGARIPADGTVVTGLSEIDESPVTGESLPQPAGPGGSLRAGTVNLLAELVLRVDRPASDSTIARILRLVEEAESARAPTERFIDRFSRWYMPAILLLALAVASVGLAGDPQTWIYRGLALLLIGCPCALVLSVPAAMASALSSGARQGLLMKGGAVVEAAAGVTGVALDKTGTLTEGRPEVTDVTGGEEVLRLAAAVEGASVHPLAQAIAARATGPLPQARSLTALAGRGVAGELLLDGWQWVELLSPNAAGVDASALEAEGKTVVVLMVEGVERGRIALRDRLRPGARAAMADLRGLGLTVTMLTGDNPRAAALVARDLGIEARAGLLPDQKLQAIGEMGRVMMVGDGINDAPALKRASVGVAMGSGTDVALETADAALLRNRPEDVAALIRLSRAAMANVRQNIALALGLKAVFLVTSVLGLTGLWLAVMADTGATVLVTLNALRLLAYRPSTRASTEASAPVSA